MKQYKAEVEMAKAKKEEEEMTLRRLIIQDYFNLLAAQKLLWIRTQDVESAKLTSEIATVEMKRGKIHPQELSRLKNLQALAESNLEMSKKDFMTYYYVLENWVGVKLNTLKIKKGVGK
jgi:outer membrane protein TolC